MTAVSSASRRSPPSRRRVLLGTRPAPLLAAAVLAAVACVIGLSGRSLGFDEGATVAIASRHGHGLWHAIARDGGNMSGYYLVIHLLIGAFGDSVWVLRLPSVLAAAATAALVAAIGDLLFGRRVAWTASILCALSLPVVYWGQTVRGYAPMLAFACLGMLAFLRLAATGGRREHGARRWAVLYVVAMALGAYCSFVAVLIIPAQLVALVRRPRVLRPFLLALVALGLLGIPLAVLAARRGSGQLFWVPRPDRQVEDQVLQSLTGSGLESSFHATFVTIGGWVLTMAALLALIAFAVRRRRRSPEPPAARTAAPTPGAADPAGDARPAADPLAGWAIGVVLLWGLLPPALAFVDALVAQPIFLPRNLLVSVPAIALALAAGICDRRLPRGAAALALVVALLIRIVPTVAAYDVSPEPWQQVSDAVLAAARPGDCIAFYPEDGRNVFRYYTSRAHALGRAPRSVLPAVGWGDPTSFVEIYATLTPARIAALRSSCRRMWLVDSHQGQVSGPARSQRNLAEFDRLQSRLERAFGHAPVRTDGYASAIHVQLLAGRR